NAGNTSGTATINALSGAATTGTTGSGTSATSTSIKIAIGGAAVKTVQLTASPASVPDSGGTGTLAAIVLDESGNSLSGVPVTFTVNAGQLTQSVVNTDTNGRATTTLTTSRETTASAAAGAQKSPDVVIHITTAPVISFGTITPANPVVGDSVTFTL